MKRFILGLAVAVAALLAVSYGGDAVDAAFQAFWNAPTPAAADKTTHAIVTSGVGFDAALGRLKAGRAYAKEKTGLIPHPTSVGGATVGNLIEIPAEYDPAKKWPLRVQLHGGAGRDLRDDPQPQSTRIPGDAQIYIQQPAYS